MYQLQKAPARLLGTRDGGWCVRVWGAHGTIDGQRKESVVTGRFCMSTAVVVPAACTCDKGTRI